MQFHVSLLFRIDEFLASNTYGDSLYLPDYTAKYYYSFVQLYVLQVQ